MSLDYILTRTLCGWTIKVLLCISPSHQGFTVHFSYNMSVILYGHTSLHFAVHFYEQLKFYLCCLESRNGPIYTNVLLAYCISGVPSTQASLQWLPICIIWASSRENLSSGGCEQHRCRPACASAQSDPRLCYSLFEKYHI